MQSLSQEERKKILNSSPAGTWILMMIVGISMVVAWLLLYFAVFLPRGIVN